jgi:hypothetical protein
MPKRALLPLMVLLAACSGDGGTGPGTGPGPDPNLSLGVGEVVRVNGGSELAAITPESGAGTYLFIPANANALPDRRESYLLGLTAASAGASPSVSANVVEQRQPVTLPAFAVQDAFEMRIRARERETLDFRRGGAFAVTKRAASSGVSAAVLAAVQTVGDQVALRIPDANSSDLCANFIPITATVKAVSTHAVILEDNSSPSGGFTATDYAEIAAEFDGLIYDADVRYFGAPSDIDQNGGRILILYTPEVNRLTPPNSTGFVGGFFWAGDLFPRTAQDPNDACTQSNMAEMFYLLVPDPQGTINQNTRTTTQVRQGTRGTIAHEMQHMINAGHRIQSGAFNEATWLDEALAHFAEDVVGRELFGFSDFRNLTYQDVTSRGSPDFNAFFFQNLARLRYWQQRPDTAAATSSKVADELADRGAAWSLLRYTVDQYAGSDVPAFTRALVAGPETSVTNLTTRAGVPFDSLMVGWMVANYADDLGIAGLSPKYTYKSWNFRSASSGINGGVFPLRVQDINPGFTATVSLLSGTGVYYRRASTGAPGTFSMTAPGGSPLTAAGARLYVLRVD